MYESPYSKEETEDLFEQLNKVEQERDHYKAELESLRAQLKAAQEQEPVPDTKGHICDEVWFRPVDIPGYPPGTYLIQSYVPAPNAVGPFYTAPIPAQQSPELSVWYGSMPESNGRENWTAILHTGNVLDGYAVSRSEYPDRVRYDADELRYIIGEISEKPDILAYDPDKHSGHVEQQSPAVEITNEMIYSFCHAISDASITEQEFNEVKIGLTAALSHLQQSPALEWIKSHAKHPDTCDQVTSRYKKPCSCGLVEIMEFNKSPAVAVPVKTEIIAKELSHSSVYLYSYVEQLERLLLIQSPRITEQPAVEEIVESVAAFVNSQKGGPFKSEVMAAAIRCACKHGMFLNLYKNNTSSDAANKNSKEN